MPGDIRAFFGGGGGAVRAPAKEEKASKKPAKKARGRKVVSDDDEDEEVVKPTKTGTPRKTQRPKESQEEETSSSAYFASKPKSTAESTPIGKNVATSANGATPTKAANGTTPSTGRHSTRKTSKKNYNEDYNEVGAVLKEEDDGDDDIYAETFQGRKANDEYEEAFSDLEDVQVKPKRRANGVKKEASESEGEDLDMAELPSVDGEDDSKRKKASTSKPAGRKRKSAADEDDADDFLDDEDEKPKKKAKPTKAAPKKKPAAKEATREESKEMQDILNSIPTVRPPTPPPRDEDRKFNYKSGGGNAKVEPAMSGTKELPEGAEDCLMGLTFVFTGVQQSLGREEGQNLVKRYGGKVTTAPSKKTSYVVLGEDAGPKKLETIAQLGLKVINEDGLFALITKLPAGGGSSVAAEAAAEKRAKEQAKVEEEAEEMERREKDREKEAAKAAKAAAARTGAALPTRQQGPKVEDRLWVDKYAPDSLSAVCGNKTVVEKLQSWLRKWPRSAHFDFRQAGADGTGIYRAGMLHGPPGIGKTTAAHLVCKLEGYDVIEMNASDTRSKKLMEQGLRGVLDTTSIMGYFAGDGKKVDQKKRNLVIIMDEVDGMSAGDRGGVGALAAVAKKTSVPMIFICNERRLPKMKPFDHVTADFGFRRPTTDMIRSRIASICYKEGLRLPQMVINAIIEGTHADIRQIINMISTIKLDNKDVDFTDSKQMSKAWEKHVILKPWDIVSKIMRPQMFSQSSTATLNEKTELYFNDHEFSYLMLQENYLKSNPSQLAEYEGKKRNYKYLELADQAAESISDGDMVDRMIHGSQQQWSLMPLHAIFSFVKPASYVYGNFNAQVGFASWLGQNSKFGKLTRFVKDVQGHMRLRTSADRHEIRQQYLPALWEQTVAKMITAGKEAVPEVIDFMDSYYLTRDDYDALIELGVGPMDMENPNGVKKIESQTKAAFTRIYNSQAHPMPFVKATNALGMTSGGKGAKREKPDLEEAIEESDEEEAGAAVKDAEAPEGEVKAEEEDMDISKDKYIKAPKKKAGTKAGTSTKSGKGKKKKGAADNDDDVEDEPPKKKAKGGGAKKRA